VSRLRFPERRFGSVVPFGASTRSRPTLRVRQRSPGWCSALSSNWSRAATGSDQYHGAGCCVSWPVGPAEVESAEVLNFEVAADGTVTQVGVTRPSGTMMDRLRRAACDSEAYSGTTGVSPSPTTS
jgi:hypothetical protein